MALMVKENDGNRVAAIEPGVYQAINYAVLDLGTHEDQTFGGESRKVLLQWELPDCRGEFERDGKKINLPRAISKRYTLSLSEMANLRKDLESWRGRNFTADELRGFDMRAVLGTSCQLMVAHKTSKEGRTYASVSAIMALPKGAAHPGKPENTLTFFSFEEAGDKPALPDSPGWVRDIISQSKEWQRLTDENTSQAGCTAEQGAKAESEEDDDVPF